MSLLNYVHPLQGTASTFQYSNGNTLPLVSMPFGMASWSPQTSTESDDWYFHPDHRHFIGLRLTQQPSPWIKDYGHFLLLPQTDHLKLAPKARSSSYRPEDMEIHPNYFKMYLRRYGVTMELAPSTRCASVRLTFEPGREQPRLLLLPFEGESSVEISIDGRRVQGYTRAHHGKVPDNFAAYFVMELDCPVDAAASGTFDEKYEASDAWSAAGERVGGTIGLQLPESGIVNVKLGISFISLDQAARNLEQEIGDKTLEQVREEAAAAWESRLQAIEIETEDTNKRDTFYTCMYRVCLFPKAAYELGPDGRPIYYSPHHGGTIEQGYMYSNIGFWDVYRTSLPLYSLLWPSLLNEMLEAWVNVYRGSGWMPKWISPAERSAMPGTLIDAAIADAYVKGIRGFDVQTAYEGLLKHAMAEAEEPGLGRRGFDDYELLGYVPGDRYHESVSSTLDYIYGDFCISRMAEDLGTEEQRAKLQERADYYKRLFDPQKGFMRPRNAEGAWVEPFDPIEWGGAYCEGGAWQSSWAVQHDLLGLAALMGGKEAFKSKLDELFRMAPVFRVGRYPGEIHEMSEMAAVDFGQFAISNQPSFHIPYIYTALGYPAETQYWVYRTLEELFSYKPDGLPGDEDNGSLSAWYIFGAMGLYPLCPGVPEYVTGSPLFSRITLHLEGGGSFEIAAEEWKDGHIYADSRSLNGQAHEPLFLTHEQLISGGKLQVRMSDTPAAPVNDEKLLPFSMSKKQ